MLPTCKVHFTIFVYLFRRHCASAHLGRIGNRTAICVSARSLFVYVVVVVVANSLNHTYYSFSIIQMIVLGLVISSTTASIQWPLQPMQSAADAREKREKIVANRENRTCSGIAFVRKLRFSCLFSFIIVGNVNGH